MASGDVLVPLGAVVRAHGIRGELRVKAFNPESTLLGALRELVLRRDGTERPVAVRSMRRVTEGWLAELEGIDSREAADALRGTELCVPRARLPRLAPGEWYLVDLVGLRAEGPDGSPRGEVVEVVEYPASRCLAVRGADGVREVPMREPYLVAVDVAGGRVVVDGLGELDPVPERKRT